MYLITILFFLTLVGTQANAAPIAEPKLDPNIKSLSSEFDSTLDPDFRSEPGITYLTNSIGFNLGYVSGKYHTEKDNPAGLFGVSVLNNSPIDSHELFLNTINSDIVSFGYNYSLSIFERLRFKPTILVGFTENVLASDGVGGLLNFNQFQLNVGLGSEIQIKKLLNVSLAESIKFSAIMSTGLKYTNIKFYLTYLFYW